jgi:hypothetical protein
MLTLCFDCIVLAKLFLVLLLSLLSTISHSVSKDWDSELRERITDMCVSEQERMDRCPELNSNAVSFRSCSMSRYLPGTFTLDSGALADLFQDIVKPLCKRVTVAGSDVFKSHAAPGLPDKEFQGHVPAPSQKKPELAYCRGKKIPLSLSYPNRMFQVIDTFGEIKACLYVCPERLQLPVAVPPRSKQC